MKKAIFTLALVLSGGVLMAQTEKKEEKTTVKKEEVKVSKKPVKKAQLNHATLKKVELTPAKKEAATKEEEK